MQTHDTQLAQTEPGHSDLAAQVHSHQARIQTLEAQLSDLLHACDQRARGTEAPVIIAPEELGEAEHTAIADWVMLVDHPVEATPDEQLGTTSDVEETTGARIARSAVDEPQELPMQQEATAAANKFRENKAVQLKAAEYQEKAVKWQARSKLPERRETQNPMPDKYNRKIVAGIRATHKSSPDVATLIRQLETYSPKPSVGSGRYFFVVAVPSGVQHDAYSSNEAGISGQSKEHHSIWDYLGWTYHFFSTRD